MTDARRRLLDALMTITAERGLEQVSVREVAAAAGVSIGTVQYYCRSKDEMLRMTFQAANDRILARAASIEKVGSVGAVLRRALLEFLPLDERRRMEATVYLAFTARAAVSADLAAVRHDLIAEQHRLCADALRLAQHRGEATSDFDADLVAYATVALVDGLLMNLLTDPDGMTNSDAIALLDHHLHRHIRFATAAAGQ